MTPLLLVAALTWPAAITVPPRPCGIVAVTDVAAPPAAACPWPPRALAHTPVVVRTYDATGIPPSRRRAAQDAASRILEREGVRPVWTACSSSPGPVPERCGQSIATGELVLRIARSLPTHQTDVLGFSYLPGVVATVLTDRVQAMAARTGIPPDVLLGGVIAHEITHLLRGPAHGRTGLMRAVWRDTDLGPIASP